MKRLIVLAFFLSCDQKDPVCITGECQGQMYLDYTKDNNGYYHVPLDWSGQFLPDLIFMLRGSKTTTRCMAADNSIIYAYFDTDTYWALDENFAITIPLYNPFTDLHSGKNGTNPISTRDTSIVLSQFKGTLVPIVQTNARIMLKEYFEGSFSRPADEFKPKDINKYYWSKKNCWAHTSRS